MKQITIISISILSFALLSSCKTGQFGSSKSTTTDTLYSNINGKGVEFIIEFEAGERHNHPTFVFWLENMNEKYIQTLFVTQSLATGIYGHGALADTAWLDKPGIARRPATLPYWLHKRGIKAPDNTYLPTPENPVPDAYTGATPKADFVLNTKSDNKTNGKFRLLFEINQPWDFNNYWHSNRYPANKDYKTSCQPSLVYATTIDPENQIDEYYLNPIGHGHFAGENGLLYTNLNTMTTALNIVKSIKVKIANQ